ncbi:hypothetical protein ACN38_g3585 [Penicillium nordicum]|uniref:Uncharacterized protein n=1 Tax=Penicillium nordicum TaxID=229535 RepID=A0A0M8PCU1_9EURO|nr:hypothetical protein ACN38_g3585 [Penicillium nordicum]
MITGSTCDWMEDPGIILEAFRFGIYTWLCGLLRGLVHDFAFVYQYYIESISDRYSLETYSSLYRGPAASTPVV